MRWGVFCLGVCAMALMGCDRPEQASEPSPQAAEAASDATVGREADSTVAAGAIGGRLCEFIGEADVAAVFDAPVAGLVDGAVGSAPTCSVTAQPESAGSLVARLRRGAANGADGYRNSAEALRRTHRQVRPLGDLGEEALLALTPREAGFEGVVLARQGEDVLEIQFRGADPAAAEALARRLIEGV